MALLILRSGGTRSLRTGANFDITGGCANIT